MASDNEIRCKIVFKMVRKNITGNHKVTVDTATTWVATHDRGAAGDIIREMIRDPAAPVEPYGGSRDNIRLTSISAAVNYLKENDCDVPFGYE